MIKTKYEVDGKLFDNKEDAIKYENSKDEHKYFFTIRVFAYPDDTEGRFNARHQFTTGFYTEENDPNVMRKKEALFALFENIAYKKFGRKWTFVMGNIQQPMERWKVTMSTSIGMKEKNVEYIKYPFKMNTIDNKETYDFIENIFDKYLK